MATRILAIFASMIVAQVANGQINAPYDRPAGYGGSFGTVGGGFPVAPVIYPGFGYGGYNPYFYQRNWGGSFGNRYAFDDAPSTVSPVAAVAALHPAHLSSFIARQRILETATFVKVDTVLTVELPFAGDVSLNGVRQPKVSAKHELIGPALVPGESMEFVVRATWVREGIAYEYNRTIELNAGDRKAIVVFNGTPVSKK